MLVIKVFFFVRQTEEGATKGQIVMYLRWRVS
jgi:hypothetical protein